MNFIINYDLILMRFALFVILKPKLCLILRLAVTVEYANKFYKQTKKEIYCFFHPKKCFLEFCQMFCEYICLYVRDLGRCFAKMKTGYPLRRN